MSPQPKKSTHPVASLADQGPQIRASLDDVGDAAVGDVRAPADVQLLQPLAALAGRVG